MTSLVVSSYYSLRPDPQRGKRWHPADDRVVKTWIGSVRRLGMRALILHDACPDSFVRRWSGNGVEFVRIEQGPWGCNDDRFAQYLRLVESMTGVDRWLFTDLSDVEFYRDPFELMTDDVSLYVGSEHSRIGENNWILAHMVALYGAVDNPDWQVLNAGIVGGHQVAVFLFLRKMVEEMSYRQPKDRLFLTEELSELFYGQPHGVLSWFERLRDSWKESGIEVDAAVIQPVARCFPIVTGHPLHTRFRAFEGPQSGAAIRHK